MVPDRLAFHWDSIFCVGDAERLDVSTDWSVADDDPVLAPVELFVREHGLVLWREVTGVGEFPRLSTYVSPRVRRDDVEPVEVRSVEDFCRLELELSRRWALMVARVAAGLVP